MSFSFPCLFYFKYACFSSFLAFDVSSAFCLTLSKLFFKGHVLPENVPMKHDWIYTDYRIRTKWWPHNKNRLTRKIIKSSWHQNEYCVFFCDNSHHNKWVTKHWICNANNELQTYRMINSYLLQFRTINKLLLVMF